MRFPANRIFDLSLISAESIYLFRIFAIYEATARRRHSDSQLIPFPSLTPNFWHFYAKQFFSALPTSTRLSRSQTETCILCRLCILTDKQLLTQRSSARRRLIEDRCNWYWEDWQNGSPGWCRPRRTPKNGCLCHNAIGRTNNCPMRLIFMDLRGLMQINE